MNPFILFIAATCFLSTFSAPSPVFAKSPIGAIEGMVVSISDGSRIAVNNNGTELNVRLYGIDPPVITKVQRGEPWLSKPGQPFAGRAFMALSNKILHRQVTLEIMKVDHHGRVVAVVFSGARNINLEMVAEGWAWASRKNGKSSGDPEYLLVEEQARAKRAGLWSQHDPQPPWEFRKIRKINKESW